MTSRIIFSILFSVGIFTSNAQVGSNAGGNSASVRQFNKVVNLGFLAKARTDSRVDGTPYLFEKWDQSAKIITKSGETFTMKDVNFDGRRNKIVAKLTEDSIYTFNSFSLKRAEIHGKVFENIIDPSSEAIKVYEVIARTPDFTILKDHNIEISEGSSNPMRGTIYSKYINREDYMIFDGKSIKKFKLKKSKILDLLSTKESQVENFVDKENLSYRNEKDVHTIVNYYTGL